MLGAVGQCTVSRGDQWPNEVVNTHELHLACVDADNDKMCCWHAREPVQNATDGDVKIRLDIDISTVARMTIKQDIDYQ